MPTERAGGSDPVVHVLWMNGGLSCDGDSVSLTNATLPSVEDIVMGAIPGLPRVQVHWPLVDYQVGDEFMEWFWKADAGQLDPFVLVVEGSIPNEEIKSEGLVRNAGTFARFLEVACLAAGQRVNMAGLARDAQVSRDTVRSYFSIFEDTLLGSWLPAYRPRSKVKEVAAPKFYWFDAGVLHAAAGARY